MRPCCLIQRKTAQCARTATTTWHYAFAVHCVYYCAWENDQPACTKRQNSSLKKRKNVLQLNTKCLLSGQQKRSAHNTGSGETSTTKTSCSFFLSHTPTRPNFPNLSRRALRFTRRTEIEYMVNANLRNKLRYMRHKKHGA